MPSRSGISTVRGAEVIGGKCRLCPLADEEGACEKREGPVRGVGFRRAGWQRAISERSTKLFGRHVDLVKDAVSRVS